MADQNQPTTPTTDTELPDQGSTKPDQVNDGTGRKRKSSNYSPDFPKGTFGNTGKAEGRVVNK